MPEIDRQQELQRRAKEEKKKKKKKKKTLDQRVDEIDTTDWSTIESQNVLGKN